MVNTQEQDTLNLLSKKLNEEESSEDYKRLDREHSDEKYDDLIQEATETQIEDYLNSEKSESQYLKIYLIEIHEHPLLTKEEEQKLGLAKQNGDQQAREQLILSNLALVASIARKFSGQGRKIMDMIQDGNLALIKAVDNFDPTKGFRFSTYATWVIRQEIALSITAERNISPSKYSHYQNLRINKYIKTYASEHDGEQPSVQEIAEALNISKKIVQKAVDTNLTQGYTELSLEDSLTDDNSALNTKIVNETAQNPEAHLIDGFDLHNRILDIISNFSKQEQRVIKLRYGLTDGISHTLDEVGNEFGLSKERIRQIDNCVIENIREKYIADLQD